MPQPTNIGAASSQSLASATLPSNNGHANLQIDFLGELNSVERSEVAAAVHLVVPYWGDYPPIPWEIRLPRIWLKPDAIRELTASLDCWLKLPFFELGKTRYSATFELSARKHAQFCLSFGVKERIISGSNYVASIVISGGMTAESDFVIDVSCMQRFVDDLKNALDL